MIYNIGTETEVDIKLATDYNLYVVENFYQYLPVGIDVVLRNTYSSIMDFTVFWDIDECTAIMF